MAHIDTDNCFQRIVLFDWWIFGAYWREIPCNRVDSKWAEWRQKSETWGFREETWMKKVHAVYLEISWQDTSPNQCSLAGTLWFQENRNCWIAHVGRNVLQFTPGFAEVSHFRQHATGFKFDLGAVTIQIYPQRFMPCYHAVTWNCSSIQLPGLTVDDPGLPWSSSLERRSATLWQQRWGFPARCIAFQRFHLPSGYLT